MTQNRKTNWFDLIMGIGVMLMIALGIYLATKLNKTQTTPTHIPTMEYGDCEPDEFYVADNPDTTYGISIAMYPDGVDDFIYQDGMFFIEYRDDDAFDMERLAEEDKAYESYNYIIIECTQKDFFDYLQWYSSLPERDVTDAEYDNNHNYYIEEVVTNVTGGKNYRYYLKHK